jgi:hypothetical protein
MLAQNVQRTRLCEKMVDGSTHLRSHHKIRIGTYATLLVVCAFLAVPSVSFAQADRAAVRAYLVAISEYEGVVFANVGEAKGNYEALASRIGSECPGVLAGSRIHRGRSTRLHVFEQLSDLREEMYVALHDALLAPDRQASFALAAKLRMLPWNAPTIRRRVDGYAKALEQRYQQQVPNPCPDMKAWVASGYQTLSSATRIFLRVYKPPRRLVITGGSTPKIRRMSSTRLQREAERYDKSLLIEIRVLKRKLDIAFGSLVVIHRQLERELGFTTS